MHKLKVNLKKRPKRKEWIKVDKGANEKVDERRVEEIKEE